MPLIPVPDKKSPYYKPAVRSVVFGTLTAEVANSRTQTIQLLDSNGVNLAQRCKVDFFMSADANGDTDITALTGGITSGTNGRIVQLVTGKSGRAHASAAGLVDFVLTTTVAGTYYLVIILPDGTFVVSPAITL